MGWLPLQHVLVHTHLKMVQTKAFSLFSFGKHCQNYLSIFKCSLTKPFFILFYWSHQRFWLGTIDSNWMGTLVNVTHGGKQGCTLPAVSMPMPFLLHHLCVAASTENSSRCSVTISLPKSWVCCELLQRSESTFEFLRRSGLFRTVINAFCLILPGCLLGGLFHPNKQLAFKSWPVTHIEHVFWQLLSPPPPRIFAWDKGK